MSTLIVRMLAGGLLLATTGTPAAPAEEPPLKPNDFAYGMRFEAQGTAAAYTAEVPASVYQGVALPNLADIAVFNGRGELVPHVVNAARTEARILRPRPVSLPVFPVRGEEGKALDAIRVTIESGAAKVTTRVDVPAPTSVAPNIVADPTAITSYIVDGREVTALLSALQVEWPQDAPQFAGRLRVEASDDLGSWRSLVDAAPIANLRAGEFQLIEQRIEMRFTRAKFWRLTWVGPRAPFEITALIAEPAGSRQEIGRPSLSLDGSPVAGQGGQFEFDLGAHFPVDRVNLELPEVNTIVEAELLSRATPAGQWRPVTLKGFYRLTSSDGDGELVNGDLQITPRADRYWLVRADIRGNPLGSGKPRLHIAWAPDEITFLARGPGPFTLAFGNAAASAVPGGIPALPEGASVLHASLGERQMLGGASRLDLTASPLPGKSTVLWIVLGAAVALLAYMAYRLARDLKR
jgi:hypothetical protein